MKKKLEALIQQAVATLKNDGVIAEDTNVSIIIDRCRDAQHGDFASNVAMVLAKPAKMNPRQL
ncbi:MAG: arginine--tRNA ligase, partial [Methyloglobulus sp.]|nr:arginine--tRNA ligase [Methyloglobulus sp.]